MEISNYTVMISLKPYSYTTITFCIITISIQAQSLSINDDRKRFLLEDIKPPQTKSKLLLEQDKSSSKAISNEDLLGVSKKYKSGGEKFDDKYDTKALELTLKGFNFLENDSCTSTKTVLNGGKAYLIPVKDSDRQLAKLSQKERMQGVMINATVGGFNFSGWEKKKLSKKSKEILQNLYGIQVQEE